MKEKRSLLYISFFIHIKIFQDKKNTLFVKPSQEINDCKDLAGIDVELVVCN